MTTAQNINYINESISPAEAISLFNNEVALVGGVKNLFQIDEFTQFKRKIIKTRRMLQIHNVPYMTVVQYLCHFPLTDLKMSELNLRQV